MQTEKGRDEYLGYKKDETWFFPKEPGYGEPEVNYIKTSWVVQDLKTIDIIEYYEKTVENAQGDEAKAEAMYQLASVYFESDDLAFYNPAMWDGRRTGSLSSLQFSSHERLPNETRMIFEHLQLHDPWAKAIPIYEEVVARYPNSKVARDALYSAAVAHERLEGRNSVWSEMYKRGLFAGPRMVTYQDVRNIYPEYQLPRGTYGWRPSTRTVNGGPGWDPKPNPVPKLTTEQRVVRKLTKWADALGPTVMEKASWVKDGIAGAALNISDAIFFLLRGYLLMVFTGFIALICRNKRREIYDGLLIKAPALVRKSLAFLNERLRPWLSKLPLP